MLDLAFVRDHLPLVEEKLRQRGMDPAAVLKDFHSIDSERRAAITAAETMKAQRNQASEEIARLKKEKQDATAQINQTKELREKIAEAEKRAEEYDAQLRDILTGIPNLPHDSVPVGKHRRRQRRGPPLGHAAAIRLHAQAALGAGREPGSSRPGDAPRKSPARVLPCIGTWAPSWSAR